MVKYIELTHGYKTIVDDEKEFAKLNEYSERITP